MTTKLKTAGPRITRPLPPESMRVQSAFGGFARARDMEDWLLDVFVDPDSPLYPEEHAHLRDEHEHLRDATVGVLWASAPNVRRGVPVAGTASMPRPHPALSGWDKALWKWVMHTFFGEELPDFLITLDAPYAAACDDLNFLALCKHELCHCAQAVDDDGCPRFRKDFSPVFTIRGHDVEENIPVVRDFGPVGRNVRELVEAAGRAPVIARAEIDWACGTKNCQLRAA